MAKSVISHTANAKAIPIIPVFTQEFTTWLAKQNQQIKNWTQTIKFKAESGTYCLISNADGKLAQVLYGMSDAKDFWAIGNLPRVLPEGAYQLQTDLPDNVIEQIALAWGLGCYQFTLYKKAQQPINVVLHITQKVNKILLENLITTIYLIRDLINTAPDDMGPADLADAAEHIAEEHGAKFTQIIGDDLLKAGYPAVHAVGRGSVHAPRLIDLRWGSSKHPKVTLIGKGVSFDTGGLDLKPADAMLLMKKDMAGGAHALGLARMIMALKLKIQLRVIIPAVENAISGDAFHPSDILATRKGLRVEITNTDAEGRLILADALAEAASEKPQLIVDFATLTGAVTLGPELSSLFTPQDKLANELMQHSEKVQDPMWRLPLYAPYRRYLDSQIADLSNSALNRFAGTISAALFLQEFVGTEIPWVHFDFMAWNPRAKPGRPEGGEAMAMRAVFSYLMEHYS